MQHLWMFQMSQVYQSGDKLMFEIKSDGDTITEI